MNRDHDIEKLLKNAEASIAINTEKKEQALQLLTAEIQRKKITCVNVRKQTLYQLHYMDKRIWFVNFTMSFLFILLFFIMNYYNADKENIVVSSMLMSTILGSLSMLIICNTFSSGIAELSDSCYFNVRQIVLLEMTILGISNLLVLLFSVVFIGIQWNMYLLQIGFYICVPLLFTEVICLGVIMTEAGRGKPYLIIASGIFSTAIVLILASIPKLYLPSATTFWGLAFLTGMVLLVIQIKKLFARIGEGEMLCIG